jgi:(S)-mandelate dehydrogenase
MDRSLSWRTIEDIRRVWPRVLIVKGLLRVDDIRRAKDAGADGVAISNHGGRQLDWAVSPLDLLPQARAAVGDGFTLLVDGGLRRGTDVVKAIALGADAVMLGRAVLYGVAAAGRAGAARAIEIVREETERTLGLLGAAGLNELGPHCLRRSLECDDS